MFVIGDRVKRKQPCFYNHVGDYSTVITGSKGTVVGIRPHHMNRRSAYRLYIVQFDGKSLLNELDNYYTESSLELIIH